MSAPPIVELSDIRRSYRNGDEQVHALAGVSLRVARGEFVAIMGSSGSGKSTMMHIIGCLDQPSSGDYRFDGVKVNELSAAAVADLRNRRLGFVFQSFHLISRSNALENVELPLCYARTLLPAAERRARAQAALVSVGMGHRLKHVPNEMSGGQQQRVAIARALVNQPDVLIADEPTGNLDSRTSLEILALLQDLNQRGITIIMVTHEDDVAAHCGRIVSLRNGRLIADDAVAVPRRAAVALAELVAESAAAEPADGIHHTSLS